MRVQRKRVASAFFFRVRSVASLSAETCQKRQAFSHGRRRTHAAKRVDPIQRDPDDALGEEGCVQVS